MNAAVPLPAGLTQAEAALRLARLGPNVLDQKRSRSVPAILFATLREPMFLLLLLAAGLYLAFGDLLEGLFLTAGALLSLGLVIVQEMRSEHALAALNALAEPTAQVIRDGGQREIGARDLVLGDLILIGEGGRVPADALLVEGDALTVDESALTGEAAPTTKRPSAGEPQGQVDPVPGEDLSPYLFASTLVVRGQGVALVTGTGATTRVGRIGHALATIRQEPTLVQRDVRRLVARMGVLAIGFCAAVALLYGLVRGDWFQGALSGITLAISLVPEEFPMVLAVFMALGAWRLARHKVLVRRGAVIETLGATTLLCVDKTGTLTENRMMLECVWRDGRLIDLSGPARSDADAAVTAAQLASAVRPHDPMDAAIHRVAMTTPAGTPLRSYPLRPDFLAFVQVWPGTEDGGVLYAAKGAPETILNLCKQAAPAAADVERAAGALAEGGLRVLAVATARCAEDPHAPPEGLAYQFQGLLGFADPVRADVPAAIAEATRAGIAVCMITGDHPATACAAARAAGIDTEAGVLNGAALPAELDADQLRVRVFARIMPEQKLQLVRAFRAAGHVVAMTGDGINDAPALAASDIGIAMGKRGTDVAREASDLILLDDRFASVVGGIRLGRRIFVNLRRAMTYITAIHVPVAGLALLPILFGLPPLLYPMHLVLLELLIDPLCSLVFEGEPSERDAMNRPPRSKIESLFGRRQLAVAAVEGVVLLGSVFALYAGLLARGHATEAVRAAAFTALVAGQLTLALVTVSGGSSLFDRRRIAFWAIALAGTAAVAATLLLPPLPAILRFSSAEPRLLLAGAGVGILAGGWALCGRLLNRGQRRSKSEAIAGVLAQ